MVSGSTGYRSRAMIRGEVGLVSRSRPLVYGSDLLLRRLDQTSYNRRQSLMVARPQGAISKQVLVKGQGIRAKGKSRSLRPLIRWIIYL